MNGSKPKTNRIKFESSGIHKAPEGLQAVLEKEKSKESNMLLEYDGSYWVFLSRGLKPTGGYAVKVNDITTELINDGKLRLTVYYKCTDPSPDQFVTQVMTYPTDMVQVKGLKKKPAEIVYIMTK